MENLYHKQPGETLTPTGNHYSDLVRNALKPIFDEVDELDISMRDLTSIVLMEATCLMSEAVILRGIKHREHLKQRT